MRGFFLHVDLYMDYSFIHGVQPIGIAPLPVRTTGDASMILSEPSRAMPRWSADYAQRKAVKAWLWARQSAANALFR